MSTPQPPDRLNVTDAGTLGLLLSRRSGSAKAMTAPGPDAAQLELILTAATRVPDHGKLTPWRFVVFEGEARAAFGEKLAALFAAANPTAIPEIVELERRRFLRAPTIVAVISRALGNAKVPEWEQVLSAGAVCMNLLLATHAQGLTGSWLTEWPSYDERVRPLLGLAAHERVAGFVYLGTPAAPLEDRPRPPLETIVTRWTP
ncbi:Putative NAD(P)H nitroreductase YdjA [Alphaproteobacteria bacterium SO-S41]|nr:Putative NAD(P)H nitroreductase YdjA [Alphaproteobacteria bacterium SO-S41]